jgi:hypothetical protein
MYTIGTKYTRVAAAQTASLIESGNTIKVSCINAAATSSGAGTVTILEGDQATVIATLELAASTTASLDCTWRADAGLSITTSANVSATVFHSQAG